MQFSVSKYQEKPSRNNDINPTAWDSLEEVQYTRSKSMGGPYLYALALKIDTRCLQPINHLVYVSVDGRPHVPSDKAPYILVIVQNARARTQGEEKNILGVRI